jgi:peptide-methionine (R)-S-oxide reductase
MNIKALNFLFAAIFILVLPACNHAQQEKIQSTATIPPTERILKEVKKGNQFFLSLEGDTLYHVVQTAEIWKQQLTDSEYKVLRNAGTERAFTGDLLNNKKKGIYTCAGCGLPLFDSETKYKSGSGWPSYYESIEKQNVKENVDVSFGMRRVEIVCARCDGHLGHVFDDGPKPTGLRYCVNSVSLDFVEKE